MSVHVPIQAITLSADTGSIEFTGIPQTFNDLVIVANFGVTGSGSTFNFQVGNGTIDTGSNYSNTNFYSGGVSGTTVVSDRASNATSFAISPSFGFNNTGISNSATFTFLNYANKLNNKTVLVRAGNGGGSNYPGTGAFMCLWRSSSSITNIKLNGASTSFKLGSTFTLYGVGVGSPKAFGGTTVTTDGTYWYHTFRSSGQFTPTQALTADYLVVAGGGSGGNNAAGGGGAGGLRSTVTATGGGGSLESSISLNSNVNYTVTVGAGAPINSTANGNGISGSNSVFASITSNGGSGGMGALGTAVPQGGSGGGAFYAGGTPGAGTTGQGYAGGGGGGGGSTSGSGGGGGAGGIGGNRSGTTGGTGGAGVSVSISGSSVTYAGGGGGGGSEFGTGGNGGSGGGGRGCDGSANNAANGTANTGGGGGGGSYAGSNPGSFGAGGSGIVIVRYSV